MTAQTSDSRSMKVRIVADDAAQAASVIREKFGNTAKVVSVKQKAATGLSGFLKKPRLEIIVEAPQPAKGPRPETSKTEEAAVSNSPKPESDAKPELANASELEGADAEGSRSRTPDRSSDSPKTARQECPAPLGTAANPVRRGTLEHVRRADSMLRSVGFDESLIERIRYELDFTEMGSMPTLEIYNRICDWLRRRFPNEKAELGGRRRAFIGSSGVGKTTALCNALSSDVFVKQHEPLVLKLDGVVPNPSDGLEAFCDILGAPLFRDLSEVEQVESAAPIYVDMPGVDLSNKEAVAACRRTLDETEVDDRVLVVNAAYESEVVAEAMLAGADLAATHVVFTHLDESRNPGKLWKYLLSSRLKPLFFSYGPNPAGEYTLSPLSFLLERTFPQGRSIAGARGAIREDELRLEKPEEVKESV